MDKNTLIGLLLIVAVVVGFNYLNKPSEEQLARQKAYNDSIALVQQKQQKISQATITTDKILTEEKANAIENDSARKEDLFGVYSPSATGQEEFYTVESELLKLTFTNKGGQIRTAELKKYRTHDSLPLVLFDQKEADLYYTLITNNNRVVKTSELYFKPIGKIQKDKQGNQILTLRMNTTKAEAYIDFIYTIPKDSYMIKQQIKAHNMQLIMPSNTNTLEMNWQAKVRQQERGHKFENRYAALYYKYKADTDVEKLSESKNDKEKLDTQVKWIAFKDQFFSSILIADDTFSATELESQIENEQSGYIKSFKADAIVPFDPTGNQPTGFSRYLGPNHFKTFSAYDKKQPKDEKLYLRKLIPLGGSIISWINRFLIIPVFNFLSGFIGNYGIIILLLTLFIKLLLFPLTYKSYMSSAKMRVLQPEIKEINNRIPAEKAMERQQATMALYRKVGVNPMSGCLPLLLQMPILIAMYNFFPASIELRQESFLWAKDLSTYDAIISWSGYIPFITPYLGNHLSLFTILMTITNILSTKLNSANSQMSSDQPGAGMMKWMMYLMPLMFLFIFNNYSSALSYYFFLSSLITVIQTYVIRASIDEKKLLAQLHAKGKANEKKPAKKGGFMARLEKMQKEQEKMMKQRNKRK